MTVWKMTMAIVLAAVVLFFGSAMIAGLVESLQRATR